MHHVKPDKRSQKSARLVCAGLLECLKDKPFDKVTITDIQRASSVGRPTFYRLFDNIDDVLSYLIDSLFEKTTAYDQREKPASAQSVFLYFIQAMMDNSALLQIAIDSGRTRLISDSYGRFASDITHRFESVGGSMSDTERFYFSYTAAPIVVAFIEAWIVRGKRESASELMQLVKRTSRILSSM